MKIRKNAVQKNFEIDREYYNNSELFEMIKKTYEAFIFTDELEEKEIENSWDIASDDVVRIYADDCDEVKVIYSKEYENYQTVVVTKSGKVINVRL